MTYLSDDPDQVSLVTLPNGGLLEAYMASPGELEPDQAWLYSGGKRRAVFVDDVIDAMLWCEPEGVVTAELHPGDLGRILSCCSMTVFH